MRLCAQGRSIATLSPSHSPAQAQAVRARPHVVTHVDASTDLCSSSRLAQLRVAPEDAAKLHEKVRSTADVAVRLSIFAFQPLSFYIVRIHLPAGVQGERTRPEWSRVSHGGAWAWCVASRSLLVSIAASNERTSFTGNSEPGTGLATLQVRSRAMSMKLHYVT